MCWQVFSNKYICNRLSVLEYIVLWTRCVILVITIANSRPGAPMNSDVAIVGSRWRHNCCHWLWVKGRHTMTRYETCVMTYVATQSSLDDFPLWIRLDLDPERVSSETRSRSKPSLQSSLKSRLLVNMAPEALQTIVLISNTTQLTHKMPFQASQQIYVMTTIVWSKDHINILPIKNMGELLVNNSICHLNTIFCSHI